MEPELAVEKKKKKRNHQDVNAPAPEEVTTHTSTEEKKKKKKHKKREQEEQATPIQEEIVEQVDNAEESGSKKKKKKKQKREEQTTSEEQTEEVITKQSSKKEKQNGTKSDHSNGSSNGTNGLQKDFYKEHPSTSAFSPADVNKFRAEHQMAISFINNSGKHRTETEPHQYSATDDGNRDMKPLRSFEELILPEPKMTEICKKYTKPTPIQSQCWPFILTGRDIIGIAETGSGKTLSFVLPALPHIKVQKSIGKNQPIALILSPTRELAIQTFETCEEATKSCGLKSACFYGGRSKQENYDALRTGVHVLVATPGRLLDLMQEGAVWSVLHTWY